jgi:hypothetical protein
MLIIEILGNQLQFAEFLRVSSVEVIIVAINVSLWAKSRV